MFIILNISVRVVFINYFYNYTELFSKIMLALPWQLNCKSSVVSTEHPFLFHAPAVLRHCSVAHVESWSKPTKGQWSSPKETLKNWTLSRIKAYSLGSDWRGNGGFLSGSASWSSLASQGAENPSRILKLGERNSIPVTGLGSSIESLKYFFRTKKP